MLWSARILVWLFLGPLMKIVDILFVHPRYRTREELESNAEIIGVPLSESVLKSQKVKAMVNDGHFACEEAMKLQHMREHRFGKLAQLIPAIDTQRKPDIPLAEYSTAQPYLGSQNDETEEDGFVDIPQEQIEWIFAPGQKLEGNMTYHHTTRKQ